MTRRIMLLTVFWSALSIPLGLFPAQSQDKPSRGIRVVQVVTNKGRKVDLYTGSHALLVGVSEYTAGWPKLESIPGEMDLLQQALEEQGFSVTRVNSPNSRELRRAFEDFIEKYGFEEQNRLLFFYSGHGYTRTVGARRKGYLVPADAPDPRKDIKGFNRRALTMNQVQTWARRIEAKHALFLFDSCFSGTIFKSRAAMPVPRHITDKSTKPVRQFITAGSAGEEVPAQSVFLPSFIRAIQGEGDLNNDGYVTGTELGQFLHQRVMSYNTGQTPQYGKIRDPALDEGDFIFTLARTMKPVVANIPKAPGKSSFSLDDITGAASQEEASRRAWGDKLNEMRLAMVQVEALERRNISPQLKQQAWGRFQRAFRQDNPFTREDDQSRTHAQSRIAYWKREETRIKNAPPPPARRVPLAPRVEVPPPPNRPAAIRRDSGRVTWTDSVTGMRFMKVPGGSFRMGCGPWAKNCDADEKPVRAVRLSTFWMAQTEVTQEQYRKIMGVNPSSKKEGGKFPVDSVTWYDVQAFIARFNARSPAKFRLPTEAEWEYACRGGGRSVSFGTRTGKLNAGLANYTKSKRYKGISPVAAYPPNPLGLYDMSGNVWEWVADKFAAYGKMGANNPNNQSTGKNRVKRGGAWSDASRYVRCENRVSFPPGTKASFRGFRLALTRPPGGITPPPSVAKPRAALRTPAVGRTWRDPSSGITFVKVSGGSFQMGCGSWTGQCDPDEKPVRTVKLSGFWIGKTEVTQAQYQKIMGANPSKQKLGGNYPVEMISWHDTQSFIRRLNSRSGERFRLPTEAEWEYACRGGGQKVKFGTRFGDIRKGLANYIKNERYKKTSPVASFSPNRLGVYDMSGNVWEWVSDKFASYKKVGTRDPNYQGPGSKYVKRGGSWSDTSRYLRCANRVSYEPGNRNSVKGFRLAITSPYGVRRR